MYRRRGSNRDQGASTLEFVLTMPLLLLFLMMTVQFALVAHAQSGAQAAADEGAAEARAFSGSTGRAEARAEQYVSELAGRMFTSHSVTARRGPTEASVTVTGAVISLVPGFNPTVSQTSTGPVERFVEEPR
jgi:Flp pilus assembly protein TadG